MGIQFSDWVENIAGKEEINCSSRAQLWVLHNLWSMYEFQYTSRKTTGVHDTELLIFGTNTGGQTDRQADSSITFVLCRFKKNNRVIWAAKCCKFQKLYNFVIWEKGQLCQGAVVQMNSPDTDFSA